MAEEYFVKPDDYLPESQYEPTDPAYYGNWFMIRRARVDFFSRFETSVEVLEADADAYFAETWGIRIDHAAEPLGTYAVLDEQKHLLFLLKYRT